MATDNKYDRQLRLWGTDGQKCLSEACTVLFNATSAGTESLKNLVLPGIGNFHIVDVEEEGGSSDEPFTNFFVFPPTASGEESGRWSRAEMAVKNLKELNPDAVGGYTTLPAFSHLFQPSSATTTAASAEDEICKLLAKIKREHSIDSWADVTVLAADLPPAFLRILADFCWSGYDSEHASEACCPPIPLVVVRSYGLLGTVRVQVPDHRVIVDPKPEHTVADLRLVDCWLGTGGFPRLSQLADQTRMDELDDRDHGHVPYVIILLKALDRWWQKHSSDSSSDQRRPPNTFQEKKAFRDVVKSMSRNYNQELNFQEAYKDAYLAYTKLELDDETLGRLRSSTVQSLRDKLNGPGGGNLQAVDLLFHSLKIFMRQSTVAADANADNDANANANTGVGEGSTPVNGSVPDMASSTEGFVRIQTLYKDRAEQDRNKMRNILDQLLTELYPTAPMVVSDEELSKFTRNVHSLRYLRTRRWTDEYDLTYSSSSNHDEEIREDLLATTYDPYEDKFQTPLLWYIALRACDAFHDEVGIFPGSDGRFYALKSDAVLVQKHILDIVRRMGLLPDETDEEGLIKSTLLQIENDDDDTARRSGKYAKEVVRYYNAEIHNIASVMGGVASQEVVKLITGQYVPMDGTYVFNGICSVAGVYKV